MHKSLLESPWVEHAQPNRAARARMYCFPYAGGTAALYRNWHGGVLNHLEICPVQLPARERRIHEPPLARLPQLVETLADVLRLSPPYAFFGHSVGALIAFELSRELRRRGRPQPVHLFVSGASAPQFCPNRPPRFRLGRQEMLAELRKLGGTSEAVLTSDELMDLLLPSVRADFALIDTYQYLLEPPLTCPVTAFAGDIDAEVDHCDVADWRLQSTGRFRLRRVAGEHFFVNTHTDEVRAGIAADLSTDHF